MKYFITKRLAINGLLIILSLFVLFHLLIILNILPFNIVWGGRLTDKSRMITLEVVSVVVNLIMLAVVLVKAEFLRVPIRPVFINIALWMMFGFFMINTIGNLFSMNSIEKFVFAPLTLILSLFCFRAASEGQNDK